jgi:hypothetical protein
MVQAACEAEEDQQEDDEELEDVHDHPAQGDLQRTC